MDLRVAGDLLKKSRKVRSSTAFDGPGHFRWTARGHHATTALARPGSYIDDPIAGRDHVHIVFDDNDGVAGLHQPVELGDEPIHIRRVQSCRWLIQDVECVAPLPPL